MSISVVTGGAGFIGSHLAARLAKEGHSVRILDSLVSAASQRRAIVLAGLPGMEVISGDIRDAALCRRVLIGADFVFHHAAEVSVPRSIEDPAGCIAVNLGGTVNLLEAARAAQTVQRFVFASSCAVYGDTEDAVKSEGSQTDPLSPYATSKLAGEYLCRNYFQIHNLPTISLRYFNVYGPDQDPNGAYAAVIPKFIMAILGSQKPVVYGDGQQSRDFVFVDDVVNANIRAALSINSSALGKIFNVGNGQSIALTEILEKLEKLSGYAVEADTQPARLGDIRSSQADISAAAKILVFSPQIRLEDGLARTLHWYQSKITEF
ncbi:MAG: NAD-dependent epimerase/dehydratase family protein [Janthinobacterium lividum]